MAGRIRTIKPEVLEDEVALDLGDAAWRLWVSSWVLADDHGRFRASGRHLAAHVWADTRRAELAEDALGELVRAGLVRRYIVAEQLYAELKPHGWSRHQKIDRPGKPRVPVPAEGDFIDGERRTRRGRVASPAAGIPALPANNVAGLLAVSRASPESVGDFSEVSSLARARGTSDLRPPTSDQRGTAPSEQPPAIDPSTSSSSEPRRRRGSRLPSTWSVTEELYEYARTNKRVLFEAEVVDQCVEDFRDYWTSRTGQGATKLDWDAAFRTWLRRHRERHPEIAKPAPKPKRGTVGHVTGQQPLRAAVPRHPPAPPPSAADARQDLTRLLAASTMETPS